VRKYYIRHKIKVGDITNLSDIDGELITANNEIKEEDIISVYAPNGTFKAETTFVEGKSVEVEILSKVSDINSPIDTSNLVLIQSLSKDSKFKLIIEKSVEIGVDELYPTETHYSNINVKRAKKSISTWSQIVSAATEQSRNPNPTYVHTPCKLEELDLSPYDSYEKICLSSQSNETQSLADSLDSVTNNYLVAIGPETGWHSDDLHFFTEHNFKFIELMGNILRTETAPIVISSIIKFHQGKL
jgi:16S rRNA (uracil1498-N3)-methyltransferase